jgi:hypothetical protein
MPRTRKRIAFAAKESQEKQQKDIEKYFGTSRHHIGFNARSSRDSETFQVQTDAMIGVSAKRSFNAISPEPEQRSELRRVLYVSASMAMASAKEVAHILSLMASQGSGETENVCFDTAKDGYEALEYVAKHSYSALIVNSDSLTEPDAGSGMSAMEFIRTATEISQGDCPQVILIGSSGPPDTPDSRLVSGWYRSAFFTGETMAECLEKVLS